MPLLYSSKITYVQVGWKLDVNQVLKKRKRRFPLQCMFKKKERKKENTSLELKGNFIFLKNMEKVDD